MMSSVTVIRRFCANMVRLDAMCAYYIMHNDCTQALHNHASLVHNPRRDYHLDVHKSAHTLHNTRRDHMCNHLLVYSRDRNRRT